MSNYGSKTTSEGTEVRGDGKSPVQTGENISGCKLKYVGFPEDRDSGDLITSRAIVQFEQPNGSTFTKTYFDSDQDWAIDRTNQHFLHIATKLVSEDDYYEAIGDSTDFITFVTNVSALFTSAAEGKTFSTKVVLRLNKKDGKYYPDFPNIPNFIELDGTEPSTLSTNPSYDVYTAPESTPAGEVTDSVEESPVF